MSRSVQFATVVVTAGTMLTACAPGLAANPRYASDSGSHHRGTTDTTATAPAGPAPIAAPKNDLA